MDLETVEAVGPFRVCAAEPVIHWGQAVELKSRWAALAVAAATDETGALQHLEVFGDGRLRERGGFRKLDHAGLATCQALEDRPPGGVGKGGEGAAQRVVVGHN